MYNLKIQYNLPLMKIYFDLQMKFIYYVLAAEKKPKILLRYLTNLYFSVIFILFISSNQKVYAERSTWWCKSFKAKPESVSYFFSSEKLANGTLDRKRSPSPTYTCNHRGVMDTLMTFEHSIDNLLKNTML